MKRQRVQCAIWFCAALCCTTAVGIGMARRNEIGNVAAEYAKLVLELGTHAADYVNA